MVFEESASYLCHQTTPLGELSSGNQFNCYSLRNLPSQSMIKPLSVIHSEAFCLQYDEIWKTCTFGSFQTAWNISTVRLHERALQLESFTWNSHYAPCGILNCIRHIILQIEQFLHNRTWVEYSRSIRFQLGLGLYNRQSTNPNNSSRQPHDFLSITKLTLW